MSEIDSTVADLMQAADAYAKDHYIEGRWAGSREELEQAITDALTPEKPWIATPFALRLVALVAAAGFAYASWQQYELQKQVKALRADAVAAIEQRDELVAERNFHAAYKPCSEYKSMWFVTNGQCWEAR